MYVSHPVLALPVLDLFNIERSTIIGLAEFATIGAQSLGLLTTPAILRWTSQFARILTEALRRFGLIKFGHYRFLSGIKRSLEFTLLEL
jgi:hypothetical protein